MALSPEDRSTLVGLARAAVANAVRGRGAPRVDRAGGLLGEKRGCFVTLTNRGRLRGCIGTFQPNRPLAEMIVEMGRAAAGDSRFACDPITPAELDALRVEVSVLSVLAPIPDPLMLEIGTHGIYIRNGYASGCFLPEVATDQGWDAEQFLTHCCAGKAGLPGDSWRDPSTEVYVFTSEKFSL